MNTTTFLAQVWGPAILAVGIGIFVSRSFYAKIYGDLEKEPLACLIFGKGLAFAIAPKLVDKGGDMFLKMKALPFARIVLLVLGVYLVWLGYFA